MIVDKELRVVKDTYSLDEGKTIVSEDVIRCMKGSSTNYYDKANRYIEVTSPIMTGDTEEISGVMLASVSTDTIEDSLKIDVYKRQLLPGSLKCISNRAGTCRSISRLTVSWFIRPVG